MENIIPLSDTLPTTQPQVDVESFGPPMCYTTAEEYPVWMGKGKRVNHSFPGPAKTDDMYDLRKIPDWMEREIVDLKVNYGN